MSKDHSGLACHRCGAAVPAPPYALRDGKCSFEACLLKDKELHAAEDESEAAYRALAAALAAALDARERETGLHSKRVACHTLVLAKRFSGDPAHLRQIYWGALLHDIGKIGNSDEILLKPGPLDEHERAVMRTHPEIGYANLKDVSFMRGRADCPVPRRALRR